MIIGPPLKFHGTRDILDGALLPGAARRSLGLTATLAVLEAAERDGTTPVAAADSLAEQRIAEVGSLRRIWTPR